ncbi:MULTISPECIES: hypothetical protein [Actinomyces]|uniref:Uncharacterized protein n=1 Tax=Actinomyces marmotae TaxID=2737173 RepID=A0A6M8B7V7_9ACTO|nr:MULTISPECIES: hypothetical protein [Actinomyces]QKD79293.1 hypothetical protein HPC72_02570 [Actinomyces marmotae]
MRAALRPLAPAALPALIVMLIALAPLAAPRLIAPRAAASPASLALPARPEAPEAPAASPSPSSAPDPRAAPDPAPGDAAIARAWLQAEGPSLASDLAGADGQAALGEPVQVHRWSTGFLDGSAPEDPLPAAALWAAPILVDGEPVGAIAVIVADSTAQGTTIEDGLLAAALVEAAPGRATAPGASQAPPAARAHPTSPAPASTAAAPPTEAQGAIIVLGRSTDWYLVSGGRVRAASHGAQAMLAGPISLRDYSAAILQRSQTTPPAPAPAIGKGEDSSLSAHQQAEVSAAVAIGLLLIILTVRRERRILAPARPPARTRPRRAPEPIRPDRAPAKRGDDAPETTKTPEMARTPEQP